MVRKSNIYYIAVLLAVLVSFTACRSTKSAGDGSAQLVEALQLKSMPAIKGGVSGVGAKAKIALDVNGKPLSVSGSVKMLEGVGAYLSVTPLGLVEAATISFTPTYVQAVNRLKGEYVKQDYSAVSFLQSLGLDYSLLQSVLMNRIYVPGGKSIAESLGAMKVRREGENVVLTTSSQGITYEYFIDVATGLLVRSEGVHAGGTRVQCYYSDFKEVGKELFPSYIEIASGSVRLSLSLSKMNVVDNLKIQAPPTRYKKVGVSELLNSLLGK